MTTTAYQVSNFSLISRLFGNLFYRQPTDPILQNVFVWLEQKGLSQVWALSTDGQSEKALDTLQVKQELSVLEAEYLRLFDVEEGKVATEITHYGIDIQAFMQFRAERGMPELESADHFALVLLTASWIEDNLDSLAAQRECFERFLLPCASQFLGKVEAHASLPFYRALAQLSREILAAMADELEESQ